MVSCGGGGWSKGYRISLEVVEDMLYVRWKKFKEKRALLLLQCHQPPHPFLRRSPPVPSAPHLRWPDDERISQDIFIIWWERGWVSANIYLKSKISLCSIGGIGNFLLPLLAGIHSTIVILLCSARKSESANTHFSRKVFYSCLSFASVSHRRAARRSSRRTVHRKCFILPASYVNELCRWRWMPR